MQEHIRDTFFDHNWKPGLITQMISTRHETHLEPNPDPVAMMAVFIAAGCPGIAAVVEYLGTKKGKDLQEFGSGSIMPVGQTIDTPFSMEAAMGLHELYIGSRRSKLTPLQWLGYFSQIVDSVPPDARAVVNEICRLTAHVHLREGEDVTED